MNTNESTGPAVMFPTQPPPRKFRSGARSAGDGVSREKIVEVALDDFAEKGYEGTTFAGIARRLGVTQPLIHYYFGGKESLWRQAVDLLFSRLGIVAQAAIEDGENKDSREALRIFIRRLVYFLASNRQLHQILMREASVHTDRLSWMADKHIRPLFQQFETLFERGVVEGTLRPVPHEYLLFMLLGAASQYLDATALVATLYGHDELEPDKLRSYADHVVDLCLTGLSSAAMPGAAAAETTVAAVAG